MRGFSEFADSGRTLMIEFKCGRCGTTKTEKLEEVYDRSGDVQSYLSSLRVPNDWKDCSPFPILCPECAKALDQFFTGKY